MPPHLWKSESHLSMPCDRNCTICQWKQTRKEKSPIKCPWLKHPLHLPTLSHSVRHWTGPVKGFAKGQALGRGVAASSCSHTHFVTPYEDISQEMNSPHIRKLNINNSQAAGRYHHTITHISMLRMQVAASESPKTYVMSGRVNLC